MHKKLTMVYWKGDKFWLGKFIEYPVPFERLI